MNASWPTCVTHEWAESVEDLLWRRTKHRLRLSTEQQAEVAQWLARRTVSAHVAA